MSISSLSVTFVGYYATSPVSAPAPTPSTPAPVAAPAESSPCAHGARRNVLYDAMLSALSGLGLAAPAPQTAAATPTASPAPTETPPSVNDAVFKFADALFQALRGGEGSANAQRRGDNGHREHHGHHHDASRSDHGYAGFAWRLETLAASVDATAAPTDSAVPAAIPAAVTPPATTAPPAPEVPPTPADASGTATPATPVPVAPATAAPQTAISKVTDAFATLLSALHVSPPAASSGSTAASQLGSFLHALAAALLPTAAEPAPQAVGLLIHVTA